MVSLPGGQGLDQAVPEELLGQQVLGAQDPALGIEPLDLRPIGCQCTR